MKLSKQDYLFCIALAGVSLEGIQLSLRPQLCIEASDKSLADRQHFSDTCIGWQRLDINGEIIEHGRVSHIGRVTRFELRSQYGTQTALPFGGSWQSAAETAYQNRIWRDDFSTGELRAA